MDFFLRVTPVYLPCTAAKARQGNHSENSLQNLLYEAFCHLVVSGDLTLGFVELALICFSGNPHSQVVVIGAGIAGLSAAHHLVASKGVRSVVILEARDRYQVW